MRLSLSIQALTLAVLVIITSVKVTLNAHFCKGELKSLALYVDAKPCEMHNKMHPAGCPFHPSPNESNNEQKPGCCEDETHIIETQDYLTNGYHFDLPEGSFPDITSTPDLLLVKSSFGNLPGQIFYTDSGPPAYGIQLCIIKQSFLL